MFLWPLSRGGGGLKALSAEPLRKELFFAASLRKITENLFFFIVSTNRPEER